jgi:hypothetical protein
MSHRESIKHSVNSCKEFSVLLNEFGNEVSSNECLVEAVFTKA